jgi:prepilin-type N-terminal cleavage/methylation domain-containing protein
MRDGMPVRGFTLIELLVVLFLVGLLTAVVFPSMERMARSSQLKTERDAIVGRLGELGYKAFLSGKSITLSSSASAVRGSYPIDLPEGWELRVTRPVVFLFNGICGGGEVTLVAPDKVSERLDLVPPSCEVGSGK